MALSIAVGLLAASCGGAHPDSAPHWITSTGLGGTIATLEKTTATATTLMETPDSSANERHTVCAVLLIGAQQANGDLPSPDETLSRILAGAYSQLGAAAEACAEARIDEAGARRFATARRAGLTGLVEAKARAEALTGGRLPTSTTRPNDPSTAS